MNRGRSAVTTSRQYNATIVSSIKLLLAYNIWFDDEALFKWSDEVVVLYVTEWAANCPAVLAEEVEATTRIQDRTTAVLARQPLRTAWHRGKDVVGIHRTNNEATSRPRCATRQAL